MRHDGHPDDLPADLPDGQAPGPAEEAPPASDLDAWSEERHRELELYLAHDREVEALRRRELEAAERERRERATRLREAELPPELRDVDDDDWVPGRRRRLVMGTSRVVAAIALVAVLALAVTAVL
jgi:hypothetical protein